MHHIKAEANSSRVLAVSKLALLVSIASASLSLTSFGAAASVAVDTAPPQRQVDFDDLDLSNAKDVKRLYSRLHWASMEVCSDFRGKDVRTRARLHNCKNAAIDNAVREIGHPALTAMRAARSDMKLAQSKSDAPSRS